MHSTGFFFFLIAIFWLPRFSGLFPGWPPQGACCPSRNGGCGETFNAVALVGAARGCGRLVGFITADKNEVRAFGILFRLIMIPFLPIRLFLGIDFV